MDQTSTGGAPLFDVRAETFVAASPSAVYAVVSDLSRSAEWSAECTGGTWIVGPPGAVGSVFRGENLRAEEVVAWAPVVRGIWHTESQVVAAEPDRAFRWAMRDTAGRAQDSVWSYEIEPADGGCVLVHHFRMGAATEGIRGITAEMDEAGKSRFFQEWADKLAGDLRVTVQRVKAVVEQA